MARDYSSRHDRDSRNGNRNQRPAKRNKPAATPNRPKKPAPKPRAKKTSTPSRGTPAAGTPAWVWGLCGFFLAIVLASGYYIFARPAATPSHTEQRDIALPAEASDTNESGDDKPSADTPASGDDDGATAQSKNAPEEKPRFSFYKMLPNYHVDVSGSDDRASAREAASAEHTPHEADTPDNAPQAEPDAASAPSPTPPKRSNSQSASGVRYVIQAGAFSTEADADRRKAQLALLGVSAEIVDINTASGKTVYRVQSDPVGSPGQAQSLAQRLKSHGIETMVRQAN
ncbi:SPOR domain-containing protein [Salinisphaera sp. Q1T1-3]|uniref:SPOR domain-containing protein n=1 Tax=Salinisphaera sp. Q1T1-3 TaxID=2321229 RepID=UPI000E70FCC7|nr:SPOR domain-containing protein [Salinisphaera sp. Q1T1-3]RJS92875.1 hypothetical protein D3260_09980 [Salinisphaera sp. Q1T1-3]